MDKEPFETDKKAEKKSKKRELFMLPSTAHRVYGLR